MLNKGNIDSSYNNKMCYRQQILWLMVGGEEGDQKWYVARA